MSGKAMHLRVMEGPVLGRVTMRQGPAPGEIGSVSSCPLCSHAPGCPPCLACRDELRARLMDMTTAPQAAAMWN